MDIHATDIPEASEARLQQLRDQMLGAIVPNAPRTEKQKEVFEKAVQYQYEHEYTIMQSMNDTALPNGVASFKIGDFSMTFEPGTMSTRLTRKTMCPAAYSILLREGLLYAGVERAW